MPFKSTRTTSVANEVNREMRPSNVVVFACLMGAAIVVTAWS
jgi:hypothetical protein